MKVKALNFDTGDTILDWHNGVSGAFQRIGERHGPALDWHALLDVSRKNDLDWDAVISCEMIGVYKPHPQAYLKAAQWLALEPSEISTTSI